MLLAQLAQCQKPVLTVRPENCQQVQLAQLEQYQKPVPTVQLEMAERCHRPGPE